MTITLGPLDYAILGAYFFFVVAVGWMVRRRVRTSEDFLTSHRSVPLWITSLAFLAANLGAQEVMGMCASGAKYGLMTVHFYWVGAIPAMIFVGVFMMPFYYGSRARSVPEFLKLRFDEKTRALNAASFAVMTVFSSGISLYALGKLFQLLLGWSFDAKRAALGGGGSGLYLPRRLDQRDLQRSPAILPHRDRIRAAGDHGGEQSRRLGGDVGATAASDGACVEIHWLLGRESHGRGSIRTDRGPGLRAVFRILVHGLPGGPARHGGELDVGRAAHSVDRGVPENGDALHRDRAGNCGDGAHENERRLFAADQRRGYDYDLALTTTMVHFYPSGLLGLGLTALMASFMSGMAGNVTAFNTVFTYDLYQSYIRKNAPDDHYLRVARWTTLVGVALSIASRLSRAAYNNIMDVLQLVFLLRERAAVCHVLARDVLETNHRPRRVRWPAFRNRSGGRGARLDRRRRERRLDRNRASVPVHHGAEFVDGDLRVVYVLSWSRCL